MANDNALTLRYEGGRHIKDYERQGKRGKEHFCCGHRCWCGAVTLLLSWKLKVLIAVFRQDLRDQQCHLFYLFLFIYIYIFRGCYLWAEHCFTFILCMGRFRHKSRRGQVLGIILLQCSGRGYPAPAFRQIGLVWGWMPSSLNLLGPTSLGFCRHLVSDQLRSLLKAVPHSPAWRNCQYVSWGEWDIAQISTSLLCY